ncbi:tRNA (adenosine(37)-N6)-threonylcarbamoyltransferase complex ATPase subunit type 1 TsaE [bacterium]|nr:tRNA (adenosine(37)-N6)-threonylcarbamoyltransferase complex ATPase subunit type 1 TsaE [bacterium]|tara:strand:+ start:2813 stop:3265 length:453 start_codon:yes stop_codon:yes gene_type:complete
MKTTSQNLEETHDLAERFVHEIVLECAEEKQKEAMVIGLYGDLGSGKTSFVQGIGNALKVKENIISPTFIIQKRYNIPKPDSPFKHLIHIDTYRLEGDHEMKDIKWDELISDPTNLIVMEWASKVEGVMPKHTKKIFFTFIDENTREIEW